MTCELRSVVLICLLCLTKTHNQCKDRGVQNEHLVEHRNNDLIGRSTEHLFYTCLLQQNVDLLECAFYWL